MSTPPAPYAPEPGDVVWISFDPQAGHEQSGHRPGLVISKVTYNRVVGLALICPITKQAKGYGYEVPVPPGFPVYGVILSDQVRSLDWRARGATFHCRLPDPVVADVIARFRTLFI